MFQNTFHTFVKEIKDVPPNLLSSTIMVIYYNHVFYTATIWATLFWWNGDRNIPSATSMDDTLHTTVQINASSPSTLMALLLQASWQNVLFPINLQRFQEENSGGIKPESCHWAGCWPKHVVLFVLHLSSLVRGRCLAWLWQQPWIRKWWSVGRIHPQTHSLTAKSCYKTSFLSTKS